MNDLLKYWLEIANYVAVAGGVLWAIIQWPKARRERVAAEREKSYAALNDHFLRLLELQHASPGLGTMATDRERIWTSLSPAQQAQQLLQFDYLSSILERAHYFLLKSPVAGSEWHVEQWKSWNHWVERYTRNPNFVAFWRHLDDGLDEASYGDEFVSYIQSKIREPIRNA